MKSILVLALLSVVIISGIGYAEAEIETYEFDTEEYGIYFEMAARKWGKDFTPR